MAHDTVGTSGSLPDNPTGQKGHPAKSNVVSNDMNKDISGQKGQDSFSSRSPKASVKLSTPAKVS